MEAFPGSEVVERFTCYGDKSIAHAALWPTGVWVVWAAGHGCLTDHADVSLARRLVKLHGAPWTHIDGPELEP